MLPSGISGTGKNHIARTRYSPATPVTDSRSCSLRKEKTPVADLLPCFPSGISETGKIHTARTRYTPAAAPTDSRSCFLRKEPPPATHYSFLLSSLECMSVVPRKTLRKRRDILLRRKTPYTMAQPDPQTGNLPKHRSTAIPHVFSFMRKLCRRHSRIPFRTVHPVVRVTRLFEAHARSRAQNCWKAFFEKNKK